MGPEVPPSIEELAAEVARLKNLAQTQLGHDDDPIKQQYTDTRWVTKQKRCAFHAL